MRVVVAWCCFLFGCVLMVVQIVTLRVDGLGVLGTVLLIVWAWLLGVFTRTFWVGDEVENAHLAQVDRELDDEARR